MSIRTGSRLLVAPDALSAERALIAALEQLADAEPWARKTVVVPSHSLRIALLSRLSGVRAAWLGLDVVTLHGLARSILERCGVEHRSGDALLPVVVERLARRERALARPLETLVDGFAGAQGAVRDLLDAGFTEEHLDSALERIEAERSLLGGDALDRAGALCRVAAGCRAALRELGLAVDADLYLRAAEWVGADPERAVPAAEIFVHGFADATGVATDLLAAVMRHRSTTAILLEPRELEAMNPPRWSFGQRLAERLAGIADREALASPSPPAQLAQYVAPDPIRETRAAIAILAAEVAAGVRPEKLALVMRDPVPYRGLLAREIDRQALPASGDEGPASPLRRRARGLIELLERRADAGVGLAFAVAGEYLCRGSDASAWELRLAALTVGARRLGLFAHLEIPGDAVRLPVFDHFSPRTEDPATLTVVRRAIAAGALRQARRQAIDLLHRLERLAGRQTLALALSRVDELVELVGGSTAEVEVLRAPLLELASCARPAAAALEVTADELILLLRGAWREVGASALGGAGGGVALLSVTEARGRTFDRLVLVGVARDRFPRAVRSDPFLPDSLRTRLRDLLPDLPVKSEGHDEERFLFAQLLGAAPIVDLLVASADEDGKAVVPSSFLAELERTGRIGAGVAAPEPAVPSALDLACSAALAGESGRLTSALALAIEEGVDRFSPADGPGAGSSVDGERWAAFHLALLAEFAADPRSASAAHLGPFFGFVGERPRGLDESQPAGLSRALDPRSSIPAVTTLQDLAGCGWRVFLGRILRLGDLPVGEDEIPELPRRLVGTVVHKVLEALSPAALKDVKTIAAAEALADSGSGGGIEVAWPADGALRALIVDATRHALAEESLDPELFALPVELAAAEALEVVRRADWPTGRRALLGIEVEGRAEVVLRSGPRVLGFRADRIELENGALLLSDYKTGSGVVSDAVTAATRAGHLAKAIAEGKWLQLPAYAHARAARPSIGRMLFLKPGLDDERRDVRFTIAESGSASDAAEAELWQSLFSAWELGSFLPRLLDKSLQEPYEGCSYCDVRVACLQGDSGARLRQALWVQVHRGGSAPTLDSRLDSAIEDGAMMAAWKLFELREPRPRPERAADRESP